MSMEVGRIDLGLDVNRKSFNQQLNGIAGGAEKSVRSAFSGLGSKIGITLGVAAVASFTKSCLDLGSALTEVQNVVDTTFTSMNGQVNSFASNAMDQFGLSETVAKKYVGVLGTMSKSMGTTEKTAYDMAASITGLSGDVASFYNLTSDEAFTKLKSIWTGETESLKDLGIVMTQTALDQYAMNNGFGKTTSEMSEQEKLMLRYQYVMSGLSAAEGDFVKTSGSWANQVRVLGLRFDSLKATLGQGFINLLTPLIQGLNNLIGMLQGAANAFKNFTELLTGKTIATSTGTIANNALSATENILGMGDAAESSAKKAANSLAGFDELNNLSGQSNVKSSANTNTSTETPGGSSDPTDAITNPLEGLKAKFQPAIDAFNELKKAVAPFAENIGEGLKWFYDNVILPVSEITITQVVPEFFSALGSAVTTVNTAIDKFKEIDGKGTISNFISDMSKSSIAKVGEWFGKLGDAFDSLTEFINNPSFENFGNVLEEVFGAFLKAPGTPGVGWLTERILEVTGIDLETWFDEKVKPWIDPSNWPDLIKKQLKENSLDMYDLYVNITTKWTDLTGDLKTFIDGLKDKTIDFIVNFPQTASDIATKLGEFAKEWVGKAVDFIVNLPQTGLQVFKKWSSLAVEWAGKAVDFLVKFPQKAADVVSALGKLAEKWVGKTVKFIVSIPQIWNDLKPKFNELFENFIGKTVKFIVNIPQIWDDLKSKYEALTKYFKGKTVDFIVNLVTSLGDIKDFIRGLINDINTKILSKLTFTVDIPFTDKDWTWSAPLIPLPSDSSENTGRRIDAYAEGAYVGANQPRLAMIGDNKHEGEIVSPESKFQEMLDAAARLSGGGITEEILYRVMSRVFRENQLTLVPDENGIFRIVKKINKEHYTQTGKNELVY